MVVHGERVARRRVLRLGALGLGGIGLADLLRARARGGESARNETAVIHVFLGGGPSHIDTFDLKPKAPAEIRGEFRPIATCIPGVEICEHLPNLAKAFRHFAVVRSVRHTNPGHLPASHWMMTGYQPPSAARRNFNPYLGAVVARTRGPNAPGMPAYVGVPGKQIFGGAGYLGAAYNPFTTESDPNATGYQPRNLTLPVELTAERLRERQGLLRDLNHAQASLEDLCQSTGLDEFTRAAVDMVTNARVRDAFDIGREPVSVRDRYGRTGAGQRCLLARRLVEAGVTFVTVLPGGEWDTHIGNFKTLKKVSLPPLDRALATLVTDLHDRGLDRRVLVLVSGEFGRTPKINANAGRDHWPRAMSVLFAGGGLGGGQAIGATDSRAMYPTTRPYSPGDVLATVYRFLGIPTGQEFADEAGRPLPILNEGVPIPELFG